MYETGLTVGFANQVFSTILIISVWLTFFGYYFYFGRFHPSALINKSRAPPLALRYAILRHSTFSGRSPLLATRIQPHAAMCLTREKESLRFPERADQTSGCLSQAGPLFPIVFWCLASGSSGMWSAFPPLLPDWAFTQWFTFFAFFWFGVLLG